MKNKVIKIGIFGLIILNLVFGLLPISAMQYGIVGGVCTDYTETTVDVYIPEGTYHLFANISGLLPSGSAYCESEFLSLSITDLSPLEGYSRIIEGTVTVNISKTYQFSFSFTSTSMYDYYVNFAITLTTLDVQTLSKTGVVGQAPFELGILGVIAVFSLLVTWKRRFN